MAPTFTSQPRKARNVRTEMDYGDRTEIEWNIQYNHNWDSEPSTVGILYGGHGFV
jgi:hypothetical protein